MTLRNPELPGQAAPSTPPPGCVRAKAGVNIANGVIDPGEAGLAGVKIDLGKGSAPVSPRRGSD